MGSRSQETIEQYAENIDAILEKNPIDVVVVDVHGYETWYVVDGFHRYHAAQLAECREVCVRLMRGTYKQAIQFAMTANWKNGLRPKKEDAARSISMLLETAPDFGFDSTAVNKWLQSFGIPASTARNHTKEMISAIKAKRDAEIMRLNAEGKTEREIVAEVGCSKGVVGEVRKAARFCPEDISGQEEQSFMPEDGTDDDESPFFDESELDTTPALNPADAFQRALNDHEATRQETQRDQSVSAPVIPTSETSSVPNTTPRDEVADAFNLLTEAWKKHGREAFASFLEEDSESVTTNIDAFMKIAGLVQSS